MCNLKHIEINGLGMPGVLRTRVPWIRQERLRRTKTGVMAVKEAFGACLAQKPAESPSDANRFPPPVNFGLLHGELAWRQRAGGHENRSNMKYFIERANKSIKHTPPGATSAK